MINSIIILKNRIIEIYYRIIKICVSFGQLDQNDYFCYLEHLN